MLICNHNAFFNNVFFSLSLFACIHWLWEKWNSIINLFFFSVRLLLSFFSSVSFIRSFWIVLQELIAYFLYVWPNQRYISKHHKKNFVRILSHINERNEEKKKKKKEKKEIWAFFLLLFRSNRTLTNKCSNENSI